MVVQALTADREAPGELVRVKAQADRGDTTVYEYRENGRTHFLIFRNSKEKLSPHF